VKNVGYAVDDEVIGTLGGYRNPIPVYWGKMASLKHLPHRAIRVAVRATGNGSDDVIQGPAVIYEYFYAT
jgi:hypothetical protein